jgi:hypothetical protein
MITLWPAARALGEGIEPLGGAVRGDDASVMCYCERVERFGRMAHRRPVGLAAHDDGHRRRVAVYTVLLHSRASRHCL